MHRFFINELSLKLLFDDNAKIFKLMTQLNENFVKNGKNIRILISKCMKLGETLKFMLISVFFWENSKWSYLKLFRFCHGLFNL